MPNQTNKYPYLTRDYDNNQRRRLVREGKRAQLGSINTAINPDDAVPLDQVQALIGGGGGVGTLQQVTTAGATTDQTILGDAGGATNYSLSPSGLSINVVAGGSTQYFSNQALLGNAAGASSSILNNGTAAFSNGTESINISPRGFVDNGSGGGIALDASGGGAIIASDDNGEILLGGVPNGNNLHNNALAQGDATVQEIRSGTYTPTSSNQTNLAANPTMTKAQWFRVGNVVTVSGRFIADPTLAATSTSFEIDPPVESIFAKKEDCSGVAFCGTVAGMGAAIYGENTNNTVFFLWVSSDIISQTWSYTFTYEVI